jgi:Domain of unknown function (DUF4412)
MKIYSRTHLAGLCLALLLAGSAFSQGLYWESTTTGGPLKDKANISQTYAMPKMFKIVNTQGVMILRMDQEKIYNVDIAKKTYSEMTFAEMEAYAKKASEKMAQFREKIKNLPPEQRKQMEAMGGMMGAGAEGPVDVSATGEKRTISGFACTRYIMKRGDKEMMTLWVTKDVTGYDNLRRDLMEFGKRTAALMNMTGMSEAYQKIDGFPMETDMDMMGKMTMVVTKVEKRSTAAGEFNVPAGFTKTDSPLAGKPGQ